MLLRGRFGALCGMGVITARFLSPAASPAPINAPPARKSRFVISMISPCLLFVEIARQPFIVRLRARRAIV